MVYIGMMKISVNTQVDSIIQLGYNFPNDIKRDLVKFIGMGSVNNACVIIGRYDDIKQTVSLQKCLCSSSSPSPSQLSSVNLIEKFDNKTKCKKNDKTKNIVLLIILISILLILFIACIYLFVTY